ncbi:MAG: hypothetical protein NZ949_07180, partial [Candidatus Kapabacteria bacterium]|nr:hypothetical protein [Candidatus Kapabacteria bacterium]MDW7996451.1 hypothetical protein [Bacteroidota bacterium]
MCTHDPVTGIATETSERGIAPISKVVHFGLQVLAVIDKEFRSEFRQRVGLGVLLLSITVVVAVLAFALQSVPLSAELFAALLWTVFFFSLSPALGRSFVMEEERGTRLLLFSLTHPSAIYWGKLSANFIVGSASNAVALLVLVGLLQVPPVANPIGLLLLLFLA